jgi:hypothetical protein
VLRADTLGFQMRYKVLKMGTPYERRVQSFGRWSTVQFSPTPTPIVLTGSSGTVRARSFGVGVGESLVPAVSLKKKKKKKNPPSGENTSEKDGLCVVVMRGFSRGVEEK